ncbi:MAG: KH domain-containing protein [Patescibacteria group bacterium]
MLEFTSLSDCLDIEMGGEMLQEANIEVSCDGFGNSGSDDDRSYRLEPSESAKPILNEDDQEYVKGLIEDLLEGLAPHNPDGVVVKMTVGVSSVLVNVECDPSDAGALIGRCGQHADAIRVLFTGIVQNLASSQCYVAYTVEDPRRKK